MVAGGIHINMWTQYLREIFRVVRPGGWAQMVEVYLNVQSDNGTLTDGEFFGAAKD
jgi:ubiquinone/menaquinone biosynthesis C-methylase UbiE